MYKLFVSVYKNQEMIQEKSDRMWIHMNVAACAFSVKYHLYIVTISSMQQATSSYDLKAVGIYY